MLGAHSLSLRFVEIHPAYLCGEAMTIGRPEATDDVEHRVATDFHRAADDIAAIVAARTSIRA
jgi:hypothetical protein